MKFNKTMRIGVVEKQLFKYAVIGMASNFVGYLVYLLVTQFEVEPKIAMSLLYSVGASVGFFGNSKFTFSYKSGLMGPGVRYFMVHTLGYLINLCILIVFVDFIGYQHQVVQAIAVFIVAAFLFVAFKFFVFRATNVKAMGEKF